LLLRGEDKNKIEKLKIKPIIHNTKTIEGYEERLFRVRVGDYRFIGVEVY